MLTLDWHTHPSIHCLIHAWFCFDRIMISTIDFHNRQSSEFQGDEMKTIVLFNNEADRNLLHSTLDLHYQDYHTH